MGGGGDVLSSRKRASIYLTNSLNGWSDTEQAEFVLRGFKEEHALARKVKQDEPILVMLGNPPYNAYAEKDGSEENLIDPYKVGLQDEDKWDVNQIRSINDLYVKFIRIAERRIAEREIHQGVVCYISNHSYLKGVCFPVMRSHLMQSFDKVWIDALNGSFWANKYKAPDGSDDLSIFDTGKGDGIKVGTAISLFCKKTTKDECEVKFRNFWGTRKREDLLRSLEVRTFDSQYETLNPKSWNWFSFSNANEDASYLSWPSIDNICGERKIPGLVEGRMGALFDLDDDVLRERMKIYFDESIAWKEFHKRGHKMDNLSNCNPREIREKALNSEKYKEENLVRCVYTPFDVRYAYHAETPGVWVRNQKRFRPHMKNRVALEGFVVTRRDRFHLDEGFPVFFTRCVGRHDSGSGHSNYFALKIRPVESPTANNELFSPMATANLSREAKNWLSSMGFGHPDKDDRVGELPWLHVLAITWSPEYLRENYDNLKQGWPRIPLPSDAMLARESAMLGLEVKALLDTETNVVGVTAGNIAEHLRAIGGIDGHDLRLTGRKMSPKIKKSEIREWSTSERNLLTAGFSAVGIGLDRGLKLLGPPIDIPLNAKTYWRGVPKAVWEFKVAGHQPISRWLSERKKLKSGTELTASESRESVEIIRRITALILMTDRLDASYRACRDNTYKWPSVGES